MANNNEVKTPIPARLYNAAVGGHVCGSDDIIDDDLGLEQSAINKEVAGSVPYDQANPNGMGRVVLKKNDNFKEVVEAQTDGNTIFVIKYDFTLTDNVTIPAGCVLEFEGGSISGTYTVDFNNCQIIGTDSGIGLDVTVSNLPVIKVDWFGILSNGENVASKINTLISNITSATLVFERDTYTINSTITFNDKVNVDGFPTFYLTDKTTTAVIIQGSNNKIYNFNVTCSTPVIWVNSDNVGVQIRNITHSIVNIEHISYFTKGLHFIADDTGCAWNKISIHKIYASLHGITIESKNGGWPNANSFYGGTIENHTGWFDSSNVTEAKSDIVFKTDGTYYANGLYFHDFYFEHHLSDGKEDGVHVIPIDICTYVPAIIAEGYEQIEFNNCRVEDYHGFIFKIKTGVLRTNELNLNFVNSRFITRLFVDENENKVEDFVYEDKPSFCFISKIENGGEDELNAISGQRVSRGGKYVACGSYGYLTRNWGSFGYASKAIIFEIPSESTFAVIGGEKYVSFVDDNFAPVDIDTNGLSIILYQSDRNAYITKPGSGYVRFINSNQGDLYFKVTLGTKAKYMVVYVTGKGNNISIYTSLAISLDAKIFYPLGLFGDDTYPSSTAFSSLRAQFDAGDKYYDEPNKTLYVFKKSGSIGNIGTITATATSGTREMTLNTIANLLVGDYITVNAVDYIIRSIDTTNSKITVNKSIPSALTNVAVTLTAPTYTTL